MFVVLNESRFALIVNLVCCFCVRMHIQDEFTYGEITSLAGNGQCLQMCGSALLLCFLAVVPSDLDATEVPANEPNDEERFLGLDVSNFDACEAHGGSIDVKDTSEPSITSDDIGASGTPTLSPALATAGGGSDGQSLGAKTL